MRRAGIIVVVIMLMAGRVALAAAKKKPAGGYPYRSEYVRQTFGKRALAGVGARAGASRVLKGGSFGKHLATGMGTHVIRNSIQFPVAALRHEDLRYHRSRQRGFGGRLKHALVSTVVTRKTTSRKKTVAAGRISGAMGSGMIASTWAPAAAGGIATGGISLGAVAATNVAREFWPQKKHRRR